MSKGARTAEGFRSASAERQALELAAAVAQPQEHPFAYAIIEGPPGQWSAVCLEGVTAREIVRLEPNGQPEPQARAMGRIKNAIEMRTIAKKWGRS